MVWFRKKTLEEKVSIVKANASRFYICAGSSESEMLHIYFLTSLEYNWKDSAEYFLKQRISLGISEYIKKEQDRRNEIKEIVKECVEEIRNVK